MIIIIVRLTAGHRTCWNAVNQWLNACKMTKQLLFHPVGNCEDEVGEKKLLLVFISATKHPTMLKSMANESYVKGLYVNIISKSYSLP